MNKLYVVTLCEFYFFPEEEKEEVVGVFDAYDAAKDFVEEYTDKTWERHDHETHDGRKFWCYDQEFVIEDGKFQFVIEEFTLNKPDIAMVKEILESQYD